MQSVDFYGDAKKVFQKSEEDIRADERAKVLEEVIKTLGNDYWNIAKIQELKEQNK